MSCICAKLALPMHALGQHAPGQRHAAALAFERFAGPAFRVGVLVLQVLRVVGATEVVRERDALRAQRREFGAALGDQAGFRRCGSGRRHGVVSLVMPVDSGVPTEMLSVQCFNPATEGRVSSVAAMTAPATWTSRVAALGAGFEARFQAGLDEFVQVAVQHFLRVAAFDAGAQILDARSGRARSCGSGCPSRCRTWSLPAHPSRRCASALPARTASPPASSSRVSRLACWLRPVWQATTVLVGMWVMRTADSVLLTCWPPAPDERYTSVRRSAGLINQANLLADIGACGGGPRKARPGGVRGAAPRPDRENRRRLGRGRRPTRRFGRRRCDHHFLGGGFVGRGAGWFFRPRSTSARTAPAPTTPQITILPAPEEAVAVAEAGAAAAESHRFANSHAVLVARLLGGSCVEQRSLELGGSFIEEAFRIVHS